MLNKSWPDCSIVAFDLETTGAYPLGSEICEIGAVKWSQGKEVGEFHSLLKPQKTIPSEVVKIHGITNEMAAQSPRISEKIDEFHKFIEGSIVVAHHAPFDLGFLTLEFEKHGLELPTEPVFCSSLLSRQLITESPNHKLQTLIKVLKLDAGQAHRALDDARACLQVILKVFERTGPDTSLSDVYQHQKHELYWKDFGMGDWKTEAAWAPIIEAIEEDCELEIMYQSKKSTTASWRRVHPFGAVRSPDGDWLSAFCLKDGVKKRYYMNKIQQSRKAR